MSDSVNYQDLDKQAEQFLATNAAQVEGGLKAFDLCAVYRGTARNILVAVKGIIGFFKPSWAAVIDVLVTALDTACSA